MTCTLSVDHRVVDGALGTMRKAVVDYSQGWLARPIEHEGSKQTE